MYEFESTTMLNFWNIENKLEPKKQFFSKIENYYLDLAQNNIPKELIVELSRQLTERLYEFYKDYRKNIPKSRKRYSELRIEDLDLPFVHDMIMDFFKQRPNTSYVKFSSQLLNMTEREFLEYERKKNQFESM
jgi:Lhr-like helicase